MDLLVTPIVLRHNSRAVIEALRRRPAPSLTLRIPAAAPGTVYTPDTDAVVQAELAAEREAAVREAARIAARADEL